ncbi:MAG: carboxypeptidase regulatory-like domain-containing protein, partial [Desulfobacteraceae bacterium]|nr:carboxypeptidase regulatory-like domain-containing protein [Desulfobacteraceae bacterium]
MKTYKYLLMAAALTLFFCGQALAHKVNLFAYVESGKIYTESYFPDGRPVVSGKIKVYDSANQLLLEGVTDPEGRFNFTIPKADDLTI